MQGGFGFLTPAACAQDLRAQGEGRSLWKPTVREVGPGSKQAFLFQLGGALIVVCLFLFSLTFWL